MPQSDVDPPGPIPNPVVTHVSARWYCPSWAGEEAGAGTPARLPALPVAFLFVAPLTCGRRRAYHARHDMTFIWR